MTSRDGRPRRARLGGAGRETDAAAVPAPNDRVSPAEDRDRQLAAAAWILGWIGGPLPAVAMLFVTQTPPWSRRLIRVAAVFWTVMWGVFFALVYARVSGTVTAFAAWWIGAIAFALAATIAGAWSAFRSSARSPDRRSW